MIKTAHLLCVCVILAVVPALAAGQQSSPQVIDGYAYFGDIDHPAAYVNITILNTDTSEKTYLQADEYGYYETDVGFMGEYTWDPGDHITLIANGSAGHTGWTGRVTTTLDMSGYQNIDIIMEEQTLPVNISYTPRNPATMQTVTFQGASDEPVTSWTWKFGDGSTGQGRVVTHRYTENGVYQVTLTVTNGDGISSNDTAMVSVSNRAPVSSFAISVDNRSLTVDAAASFDPDGTIVQYGWRWQTDDGWHYEGKTAQTTYPEDGTYTVCLKVTDNDGDDTVSCMNISIQRGRKLTSPVANFSWTPHVPAPSASVFFTDMSHNEDGSIVNWTWDFGDGNTSSMENPTHSYAEAGEYIVRLTVTDTDGLAGAKSMTVNVSSHTDAGDDTPGFSLQLLGAAVAFFFLRRKSR